MTLGLIHMTYNIHDAQHHGGPQQQQAHLCLVRVILTAASLGQSCAHKFFQQVSSQTLNPL